MHGICRNIQANYRQTKLETKETTKMKNNEIIKTKFISLFKVCVLNLLLNMLCFHWHLTG